MSASTDPTEFFREIREMNGLLMALVETPEGVKWHWPAFYLIYVELDRMSWRLANAENTISVPIARDDQDRDDDVENANHCFNSLGKGVQSILDLLWNVSRGVSSRVRDVPLKLRLQAHLHPKSSWYQTLRTQYRPGTITPDGRFLNRTILVLEPTTFERIDTPQEQFLLRHQAYDLSNDDTLLQLKAAVRQTAEVHVQVLRA